MFQCMINKYEVLGDLHGHKGALYKYFIGQHGHHQVL